MLNFLPPTCMTLFMNAPKLKNAQLNGLFLLSNRPFKIFCLLGFCNFLAMLTSHKFIIFDTAGSNANSNFFCSKSSFIDLMKLSIHHSNIF